MAYVTDGAMGVNLDSPSSACVGTPGEMHEGNAGSEWIYVFAPIAISKGACCTIDSGATAVGVVDALAVANAQYAFAQTSFAASTWGYMAKRGQGLSILVTGSAITPNVPLYTSNTAGALTTATNSASAVQIWGVGLTSTVSGTSATAGTGNIAFPMSRRPG